METIALGCDHAGLELKNCIISWLVQNKLPYNDFGTYTGDSCDYPVFAKLVSRAVLNGTCQKGIIVCGTGIGVSIVANKFKGIRAALCSDTFSARAARLHNDANILTMGARVVGTGLALDIVDAFVNTKFSGDDRHIKRILQIEEDSNNGSA